MKRALLIFCLLTQPAAAPAMAGPPANGPPPDCSRYPTIAIRLGHQGVVGVTFTITTDGTVRDPQVSSSSGFAELDAAALCTVARWRYEPALKDGQPVEMSSTKNVTFKLAGTAADAPAAPAGGQDTNASQP